MLDFKDRMIPDVISILIKDSDSINVHRHVFDQQLEMQGYSSVP